jgi:hypothetical protein
MSPPQKEGSVFSSKTKFSLGPVWQLGFSCQEFCIVTNPNYWAAPPVIRSTLDGVTSIENFNFEGSKFADGSSKNKKTDFDVGKFKVENFVSW